MAREDSGREPVAVVNDTRADSLKVERALVATAIPAEALPDCFEQDLGAVISAEPHEFLVIAADLRPLPFKDNLRIADQRVQRLVRGPRRPGLKEQVVGLVIDIPRLPKVGVNLLRGDYR